MSKGNRRHHRSVKGLRGESRKVRNLKRQWSADRADRALSRCPDCGGEGGGGTMDPDVWIECVTCDGAGQT